MVVESSLCQWNLDSELPFVIEISNSLSCIPDSTSKIFPDLLTRGINKPCDQRPFDLHR